MPFIRTYRPVPVTLRVCVPPVPVVVREDRRPGASPSADDLDLERPWRTPPPRSATTWQIVCGGAEVDLQPLRVGERAGPAGAGVAVERRATPASPAFSVEDAVAGWPSAASAVPQVAAGRSCRRPGTPTASSRTRWPRAVPFIRTYRPVPLTVRVWVPPVPVVVRVDRRSRRPSRLATTWIWNDRAKAASQFSTTWSIDGGRAEVDLQPLRIGERAGPAGAGVPVDRGARRAFPRSPCDDAVAGLPWDSSAPAAADRPGVTARYATSSNSAARTASGVRR